MKQEKEDKGKEKGKDPDGSKVPVNEGDNKGTAKKESSGNPADTKQDKEGKPLNPTASKWTKQDVIGIAGLFLTSLMAYLMYTAVRQTDESLTLTRKSIESADSSFKIQNAPFLQASDFTFVSFEDNKQAIIKYSLSNLGNYPIQLISGRFDVNFGNSPITNPFVEVGNFANKTVPLSEYIVKGTATLNLYMAEKNSAPVPTNFIERESYYMYFGGEIVYMNQADSSIKTYVFNVRMTPPQGLQYRITYNKNY
jgi:hypothetical protein